MNGLKVTLTVIVDIVKKNDYDANSRVGKILITRYHLDAKRVFILRDLSSF